jgi:hypothetical protein
MQLHRIKKTINYEKDYDDATAIVVMMITVIMSFQGNFCP